MSAKKIIEKERIVQAACQIVAESGMDALNMRELAKRCACSTQPIYLSFVNAEDLKRAVYKEIEASYNRCINDEIASGKWTEYKAAGMAYIRFAKEQPQFFKYLFMRDRAGETVDEMATEFQRESTRAVHSGVSGDKTTVLHTHMWIYVHGIATMYATGFLKWDWDTVSALLTEEFLAIKSRLENK
ncbi:MAG: TetR/AcrR family transcriptional regulator [Clostridiales bacterium]|nr:TetR/AcrR family transcriptional regulator [Clostridiales bacterium]